MNRLTWSLAVSLVLASAGEAAPPDPQQLADRIDRHLNDRFAREQITPAPIADDAEFLRRAFLDLTGRIPSSHDVRVFLADPSTDKRRRLIEQLLGSPRHATHFAAIWRAMLLPETASRGDARVFQPGFEAWLRDRFRTGMPYDRLVRELLATPISSDPKAPEAVMHRPDAPNALAYFAAKEAKPENLAASTARVFLGIQIECAQCHDHPFAKWSRQQFWATAAFFAGIERQGDNLFTPIVEVAGRHDITLPESSKRVQASFLDDTRPTTSGTRAALAEWVTHRDNPFFARATVNRVWGLLMGVGLVDPVDDFRDDNPPSHPELLDELARAFADSGFDLRYLVQAICLSQAYQRTSARSDASQDDPRLFARMSVKGLTAEQLFDSLALATGYRERTTLGGSMMPDRGSARARFLNQFALQGKISEPETSIAQALTLMNGRFVADATDPDRCNTLIAVTESPGLDPATRIEALYLAALSRRPTAAEAERALRHVRNGDMRQCLADLFWVLLNSAEFRLNH